MYILILNQNKEWIATHREAIVQFSNLCDKIRFLVPPTVGDNDIAGFDTVQLRYVSPLTKKPRAEYLVRSEELYKEHYEYVLPVDTKLSAENGDVEMELTLYASELNSEGEAERKVLHTQPFKIKVFPVSCWSNFVDSGALSALDERVTELQAMQKQITEMQGQVLNIIDDTEASSSKTYSSEKIESFFIDNDELDDALDDYKDIIYSEDKPGDGSASSWFKIDGKLTPGGAGGSDPTRPDGDSAGIINDSKIADDSTYSSRKIEGDFIDNKELEAALDTDTVYSENEPVNSKANFWLKIDRD